MKAFLLRHKAESLYLAIVLFDMAASRLLHCALGNVGVDRFMDNLRWTVEIFLGCGIVALNWRRAAGEDRKTLRWFLIGGAAFVLGQFFWDLGAATGTLHFPGIDDFFYLSVPVALVIGLLPVLDRGLEGKPRWAVWINMTSIVTMILVLSLALYLPSRGSWGLPVIGVLVLYPVLYGTVFGLLLLTLIVRRIAPEPGVLFLLVGLGSLVCAWLRWNLEMLHHVPTDGSGIGYFFSFAQSTFFFGLALWRERVRGGAYQRGLDRVYLLLPVLLLVAAGVGLFYGVERMGPLIGLIVRCGVLVVVICTLLRQTVLLYERDQAIESERQLRESGLHLRAIFENGSDLIFGVAVGADGSNEAFRYNMINPAGSQLSGLLPERFVGSTPAESFPPEKAAFYESNYRRCLAAGKTITYEQASQTPHGAVVFETTLVPVQDCNGRITQIMGISRNITAQKSTLDAMTRLNLQLEIRVAERTQEMDAAYQELEMFSYSVSHDLRSPLRGIDSLCSTLAAKHGAKLEPEARGYLQKIEAATGRMGQIIDDLLLLSRVARSKLTLQPVDLSALATRIAGDLQASAPARALRFEIAPGLSGWGDYRLLQNVLENLLGNAWKYTGRTSEARIVFDCIEKEGRPVFRVRDNGAGFDMRFVQKLFQNFQRLHDQTEFEGTGIGLAIVARIIRRHGGEVWAEGAVGAGATFSFTLGEKKDSAAAPA